MFVKIFHNNYRPAVISKLICSYFFLLKQYFVSHFSLPDAKV